MSGLATSRRDHLYRALSRKAGVFAMVALDQRQSLATMFDVAGRPASQDHLDTFRQAAARRLMPHASAILLETGFLGRGGVELLRSATCGRIIAVDRLIQQPGKPVEDSAIDATAFEVALSLVAHAVKLLVVWTPGKPNSDRVALVRRFVDLAHENGFLALVECIVQRNGDGSVPSSDYLRAARELHPGADLYKAQVPIHDGADDASMERLARQVTATVDCPWVVLSTGVEPANFPRALAASCRGGASGFLAGRAIWGPSIHAGDVDDYLEEVAVVQLAQLARIVDESARPWMDATAATAAR